LPQQLPPSVEPGRRLARRDFKVRDAEVGRGGIGIEEEGLVRAAEVTRCLAVEVARAGVADRPGRMTFAGSSLLGP